MFAASAIDMGVMMDDEVEMPCTPVDQLAIHTVLDDDLVALKERAMCAQATQVLELHGTRWATTTSWLREESFRNP